MGGSGEGEGEGEVAPLPIYRRGLWFATSDTSSLKLTDLQLHHTLTVITWISPYSDDGTILLSTRYPAIGSLSNDFFQLYYSSMTLRLQYYRNAENYLTQPFEIAVAG
jgi:hypothetical protein